MTVAANPTRTTEIGLEKWCPGCEQWWPADAEFFHTHPEGHCGLRSSCKACALVEQRVRRGQLPAPSEPVPDVFTALRWGASTSISRPRAGATERAGS